MRLMARLTWNELIIMARDPAVLFWIVLFPVFFMFMLLFAFGSSGTLPQQTIEIVDLDHSELSIRYIEEIRKTFSGTESIPGVLRQADADTAVAQGASRISVPEGFGASLQRQYPVLVKVTFAEDGMPAQLVTRVVRALTLRFEADIAERRQLIDVRSDPRGAAPAIRFVHYVLTGTMVMSIMSAGMMTICMALAYRRERNGFKMLACMPLSAPRFLLGMLLARLVALLAASVLLVLVAQHLFGVPLVITPTRLLKGMVVMLLGGAMMLALGLALGGRLSTTNEASFVTGLAYIALLLLCDLTMPMSVMPPAVREKMSLLPPALFVHALRQGFILDDAVGPQLTTLAEMAGWLVLFSLIAVGTFRWHKQ
jgi:ABC-2 type transport system permease protein